jgi:hypothetical protein
MLAEAFDEEVETFCLSQDSVSDVTFKIDLLGVYRKFIDRKYDIYQKEKNKAPVDNVIAAGQIVRDLKVMKEDLLLPALKVLFTEEEVELFEIDSDRTFLDEDLTRLGIVDFKGEGKLRFIHRTFAEFIVAGFFVNQLKKRNKASPHIQHCLFKDIFLKADYRVVRAFIDGCLSRSWPSKKVLKEYGNRTRDLREDSEIVYQAACEGNANIIGFLLDSLQEAEHTNTLVQLLLAQYKGRQTAWHVAGKCGNIQVLQKLWNWGKEKLTGEDLNNKYLLARDSKGKTAWHVAAEKGKLEVLQQLWEWAKKELKAEELNDKFLLARDGNEQTFLHVAAERNNPKEFENMWKWATENLELNNALLAKDHLDHTVFNVAANRTNNDVFRKLWAYATEKLTVEDIQILFTYRQ